MVYRGVIIEECLEDRKVLGEVKILETKVQKATEREKIPWPIEHLRQSLQSGTS